MTTAERQFQKVAITGGAGYVGSVLVPFLLESGYDVTVVDLFLYGRHVLESDAAESPRGRLTLVEADIRDEEALHQAFEGQDAVIHLACVSNDPSFELDPELGKTINFGAFPGILRAVKASGVRRFINASSSSVYGVSDDPEVREESECRPLTDYSKFKLECERFLAAADIGVCDWVTLRPATVCGYAPRVRLDVIVNILTISALARGKIRVFGGDQLRPNIHIKDMAEAYRVALEASSASVHEETFNAGYENRSVADLARLVCEEVGDPDVEIVVEPTDDPRSYHISSNKIASVLGFTPSYTIRDAVRSICDAYAAGKIPNATEDSQYYNIKRMQEVGLTSEIGTRSSV